MKNIFLVESNFEGICPDCKEWTTAGDSCCGMGAYVEGRLISDEAAQENIENPVICVRLVSNAPEEKVSAAKHALLDAGVSCTMFSHNPGGGWNLNVFVPAEKKKIK